MAQHFHVPKFGNWDTDNVPYTAYFENARKEKGGIMMNPNDPMENPEAFNMCTRVGENADANEVKASRAHSHKESSLEKGSNGVLGNHTRRHLHHRSKGSQGSFTTASASERSHSDHSAIRRGSLSDHKRSITKGSNNISSFSSSSHNRNKSGSSSFIDHTNHQAIPKFGTWDVTDPKSGEGYTAIFSKIKEERQITSTPSSTPPLHNCSNIKNQYGDGPSFRLSKYCCCLFSSESK